MGTFGGNVFGQAIFGEGYFNPDNSFAINLIVTDPLSLSDLIVVQVDSTSLLLFDQLQLIDSGLILCNLLLNFSDSISLKDLIALDIPNALIEEFDSFDFHDSQQLLSVGILSFGDSLNLSDSITNSVNFVNLLLNDNLNLQDNVTLFAALFFAFNDSLSLNDLIGILLNPIGNLLFSDSINLSDAINVQNESIFPNLTLAIGDSFNFTDSDSYSESATSISTNDGFMFSDTFQIVLGTSLNPYLRRYLNDVVGTSNQ